MKKLLCASFFISLMLFCFTQNIKSQEITKTGKITGVLLDRATQQPVIGANVTIQGTVLGAISDLDGKFSISKVKVGNYVIKISCIGYKTILQSDVIIKTSQPTQLTIQMDEESIMLGNDVTVEASLYSLPKELTNSAYTLNYEEIRRQAGTIGDVHRLVQAMPGVVPANDQRNDLIVRGGSPSENLTIIDNVEVPNISHFGTQGASGGPISILNSEFIQDADFIAGGFPAHYGNKLSSVLNIKLRDGNKENYGGIFNLSTTGACLMFEGPISSKGNFMVSARRSWVDLVVKNLDISAVPVYSNYQVKATYNLDQNNKIWIVSLGGIDDMDFKSDFSVTDDPAVYDVISGGNKLIAGINWLTFFGKKGFGVLGISDARQKFIEKTTDPRENGKLIFENNSIEGETTIKYDLNYTFENIFQLNGGISTKFFRSHFDINEPFGSQDEYSIDSSWRDPKFINKDFSTYMISSYWQFSKTVFERLEINLGLRYDYFDYIANKSNFSPRINLRYNLLYNLSLNASYGSFYQLPPLYLLNVIEKNRNLKPIKADHFILGLAYFPTPDIKITLEGYYKEYSQYPVSNKDLFFSLSNSSDEFSILSKLKPLVSEGTGKSRGIEFYIQKKLTDNLYGQISYSLSKTEYKSLDGITRSGSYDIPHILSISGGYKLDDHWEFSAKFTYTSGRPYTPPDYINSKLQNRQIYDITKINSERIPDYNRLDIRADYRVNFTGWNLIAYLELQNAYDRKNIFRYIWNEKTNELIGEKQWPMLPNFGLKIEI